MIVISGNLIFAVAFVWWFHGWLERRRDRRKWEEFCKHNNKLPADFQRNILALPEAEEVD